MRTIPDSFDHGAVAAIDALLAAVAADENVAIPLAVESGSRAWGFPSPDSDYDCRFVFVRSQEAYLSPWRARDVIEREPDDLLDVNGWDLKKAIQLLVKGNATITEWMTSPVTYVRAPDLVEDFLALADEIGDRALVGRHYLHVARQQWSRFAANDDDDAPVPLKKVFYSLRPALALRWLNEHHETTVPPMALADLVVQTNLRAVEVRAVEDLIAAKSLTSEMGTGPVDPVIRGLIGAELVDYPWLDRLRPDAERFAAREAGAELFRRQLALHGPE